MLRRAHEARVPDHPEQVYYVACVQWPDGSSRQAHFVFDEKRYEQMQLDDPHCATREHIVLEMMSQMIEQIFTARRAEKRAKQIFKPR